MAEGVVNHRNSGSGRKPLTEEEIEKRFGFHKASIEGPDATVPKHAYLRRQFVMFSEMLNTVLGEPTREASLAFTALEESSMWAHKALAQLDELVVEEGEN